MNLKTLFLMTVVSLSSMLLGSDSRGEVSGRNVASSDMVNEKDFFEDGFSNEDASRDPGDKSSGKRIASFLKSLSYRKVAEVGQVNVKAGVLAMFLDDKIKTEDIAGAPRFMPAVMFGNNENWSLSFSTRPRVRDGIDFSTVYASLKVVW